MRAPLLIALLVVCAAFPCAAADYSLAELEHMASANPASTEAWDRYGMALAHSRRFKESLDALNHALSYAQQEKKHLEHHLALVYAWSGNYKEAAHHYSRLLQRYPRDNMIRIDFGQTLAWDLRYRDAATQYERVLASEPHNTEALRHLGVLEAWQGRYDSALAMLERGLEIDTSNPELIADRANVLSWKGDLAAALEAYETLVKITPENAGYWLKLAQVYAWNGRSRQARESYEKVLSLDAGSIEAYLGIANHYRDNHQYAEAEQILRAAMIKFPADARPANELAALSAQKSLSLKDAIELAESLIFAVILLLLAIHIWRERRVLRRRQLIARVLLPALPALLLLIGVVYVDVLFAGSYYQEVATAAQLLEPVALGVLLTLILIWRLHFERPQRQKTVLAIGAHPDDIEFGCGATILRMREEGATTYGLVLTGGECGHNESDDGKVRVEEACSAARVIALADIELHNFPDTLLHEHKAEIRMAIEKALARWRPDIIFTHNGHDVHTDHHTVYEATREAARGAYTILCYENPNTPPGFHPGYFFDVGNYIDGKIAALACHKTQMGKAYAASGVVRAMAGFRGTQARVPFAEGFEVMRVLEKATKL
jgi:LmbE family N-acetylglucosaminyl deacetylase/tetratricopeptide (TPR) repeat protein